MRNLHLSRPELPFLEARYAENSQACYRKHSHPTYSIGTIETGSATHYQRGRYEQIGPGMLVMIEADLVHQCQPLSETWSYHMLYLDSDWLEDRTAEIGLAHGSSRTWLSKLPNLVYDPALCALLKRLNQRNFENAEPELVEGLLVELLEKLHQPARLQVPTRSRVHPAVVQVRDFLQAHLERTVNLRELEELSNLSRYHLIRLFKGEVGLTPYAYHLNLRVAKARELLREGCPIREAAQAVGFSDQAHLQRQFKEHVAMTPGEYRLSALKRFR